MILRKPSWLNLCRYFLTNCLHSFAKPPTSRVDFKKLRPMILKRIEDRSSFYPIKSFVPVAQEVLNARARLIQGVSKLIQFFPVLKCKFCSEVFIGETGHLIQTCKSYRRKSKNRLHEWVPGSVQDIIVPVETFHLDHMFQKVIKHQERFDFDRIPAVVELCCQSGADLNEYCRISDSLDHTNPLPEHELKFCANNTLKDWETVRWGVKKLLMVYPVKVCCNCDEVHVGPSGHRARLCGVFKNEHWNGFHFWKNALVDDLVPPKIVWRRRCQDPPVLVNEGKGYYGHSPAIVDLCLKAGAMMPRSYGPMMKEFGLTAPR